MKVAYFDCFAGLAGDMALAAMIDAGCNIDELRDRLKSMTEIADEWDIVVNKVQRGKGNIRALNAVVNIVNKGEKSNEHYSHSHGHSHSHDHSHSGHGHSHGHIDGTQSKFNEYSENNEHHRTFEDVCKIIKSGTRVPDEVKAKSIEVFRILAEAEAHIHSTTIEKVHFHEVGAIDSIIDTVGAVLGLYMLEVLDNLYCSSIPLSEGVVKTAHGYLPVPAPACSYILEKSRIAVCPARCPTMKGELVTPTGASLLAALVKPQNRGKFPQSSWVTETTGVGAGSRNPPEYPNICRLMVGHVEEPDSNHNPHLEYSPPSFGNTVSSSLSVLECNIDDMTAEVFGFVMEVLTSNEQVLDVWFTNIQMKKNRPAQMVSVLCKPEHEKAILQILFMETSTLGVRRRKVDRVALDRFVTSVETSYGQVTVKRGFINGELVNVAPEYEECKKIATKLRVPLMDVMHSAKVACLEYV